MAAGLAAGAAISIAIGGWWFFASIPTSLRTDKKPSLAQLLLSDRTTLGFVRLGLLSLALFVVVSVAALAASGRWLKSFGKDALTADDAEAAADTVKDLRVEVNDLKNERDVLQQMLDHLLNE